MKHVGRIGPNPDLLVKDGPLIEVTLRPHKLVAQQMLAQGQQPGMKVVRLMVDTGAERTIVENKIAEELGLKPIRYTSMVGVSQEIEERPVYRMEIEVGMEHKGDIGEVVFGTDVVGMNSPQKPQKFVGLLGRDFLRAFRLVYNGPLGTYEINDGRSVVPPMSLRNAPRELVQWALDDKKQDRKKRKRKNR